MNRQIKLFMCMLLMFSGIYQVSAQENVTIVTQSSQIAEGLDLNAVAEIFKDSENLEEFERTLNDPELGINNLDLDGDGYVDYIRVVEHVENDIHIIILQVALGEDEFQDVATIEVERTGDDNYNLQVRGNEVIYGVDYYIAPAYVHVHDIYRWSIIPWIYRPMYHPYYSGFYFGYYPVWWRPYRPVVIHVYHDRTERYRRRATFEYTRDGRAETLRETNYQPRTSPRVRERMQAAAPTPGPERISRQSTPGEQPASVEKRINTRNSDLDKTTIKSDAERITKPPPKRNTTVKSDTERITKPQPMRRTTVTNDAEKIAKPKPQPSRRTTINKKSEPEKIYKPKVEKRTSAGNKAQKMSTPKPERKPSVKSEAKKISKPKPVKNTPAKKESKKSTAKEKKKKSDIKN
jgi:hypothetical protein